MNTWVNERDRCKTVQFITEFVQLASVLSQFQSISFLIHSSSSSFSMDLKCMTPSSHGIRLSCRHSLLHIIASKHITITIQFQWDTTSGIQLLMESGTMYHSLSGKSRSPKPTRNGAKAYNAVHLFLTIEWALLSLI